MISFEQYRYGFDKHLDADDTQTTTTETEASIDNWLPIGSSPNRLLTKNIESNYISIQSVPGVKIWTVSSNNDLISPILIGSSGILEIDFSNNQDLSIPGIEIKEESIQLIEQDGGYIIVNFGVKERYPDKELPQEEEEE